MPGIEVCREGKEATGFTILELLCVIGIIAIMASLLLPVLFKVRSQATAVVCLSNMRQLGAALYMYAQDNRENLPYPSTFYGDEILWFNAIDPHLLGGQAATSAATRKVHLVKQDPVITKLGSLWLTNAHSLKMNQWLGEDSSGTRRFYALPEFTNPGRTVLLFDGRAETDKLSSGAPAPTAMNPQGSEGLVSRRHAERANVLLADGHAENRTEKQQLGGGLGWAVNQTRLIWKPWTNLNIP